MGALYFGADFFESRSTSSLIKALLLASLSVYSLFSMAYFWVGLAATLTMACFLKKDWNGFKRCIRYGLLIGLALLGCIAVPVFRLRESGSLHYGGYSSFYSDTLVSLAKFSLYSLDISSSVHLTLNFLLGIVLLVSVFSYFKNRNWNSVKTIFLAVSTLSVTLIILAHHFAGVLYPINRVALFLYPLFVLSLCFGLNDFSRCVRTAILSLLLVGFTINLCPRGIFVGRYYGVSMRTPRKFSIKLMKKGRGTGRGLCLACTPAIYYSVNYYVAQNDYPFIKVIQERNQLVLDDIDYYLLLDRDTASFSEESIEDYVRPIDLYDKDVFIAYPDDHLFVFENLKEHYVRTGCLQAPRYGRVVRA